MGKTRHSKKKCQLKKLIKYQISGKGFKDKFAYK